MAQVFFYYSSMNAGKTTQLLQSAYNYRERKMNVLLYKPSVDTREGSNLIRSRIGLEAFSNLITGKTDIYHQWMRDVKNQALLGQPVSCIMVDEAQFLNDQNVRDIFQFAITADIPVLCYGIRTDFQGELWAGSARLLAWAQKLVEIKGVCHCGSKATMVARHDVDGNVVLDGEQLEVDGNDVYTSYCLKHWLEETRK